MSGHTIVGAPIMASKEGCDNRLSWILKLKPGPVATKRSGESNYTAQPKDNIGVPGRIRASERQFRAIEAVMSWNRQGDVAGLTTEAIK